MLLKRKYYIENSVTRTILTRTNNIPQHNMINIIVITLFGDLIIFFLFILLIIYYNYH